MEPLDNGDCSGSLEPAETAPGPGSLRGNISLFHPQLEPLFLITLAHEKFNLNAVGLIHIIDTIESAQALTTEPL